MVNINSLAAHQYNIEFEVYPKMKDRVLQAITFLGEATMHSVANHLGVQINTISGRFGELVKANKLEIVRNDYINNKPFGVYKIKK